MSFNTIYHVAWAACTQRNLLIYIALITYLTILNG